ncbi:hypothetical protein [Thermogemmatispora onikobensis]|uniref:hypothetical protein n=1 Tax=Thermogemmatispora onikobensis TaxID=732234 RepID=UPI00085340F9|nr:hypothetical protein [Thermogemmatispora onikobensis]
MSATFAELYAPALKEVFTVQARQRLAEGVDGLEYARSYAERGKPDFVLAFLLLVEAEDDLKRELLAYAYERRAVLSEQKAASFARQFRRSFPLVRQSAHQDRLAAQRIRAGQPLPSPHELARLFNEQERL